MIVTKQKLKKNLHRMAGDCRLIAKKGDYVDTYRRKEGYGLWIQIGDIHQMLFKDEEDEYFDINKKA